MTLQKIAGELNMNREYLHIKKICAKMIMKMVARDRNQEDEAFAENFSKTIEITHSYKNKWRLQYDT
jgi:menaquinone-dependent protoporphyrinogen IX oxidase